MAGGGRVNADRVATETFGPEGTGERRPRKVVSEDGTPIAVWRSGEGPPLVLIHDAADDHNRWAPVLPALEERFAVFAVDRRGRGGERRRD
jgi:pimeloyl-ACP methyl ester carboxylesterase